MSDKKARIKWTYEMIKAEALKYETKSDFEKGNPCAYSAALKRKIINDGIICAHMIGKYMTWTNDDLLKEALRFTSRVDFQKNSHPAYLAAYKRGIMDVVCKHMEFKHKTWTTESIRTEALKYSTRKEFAKGSSAYAVAVRRGMLNDGITCQHMKAQLMTWTIESIHAEALKYTSRSEFKTGNPGAFGSAKNRNILNDVCSHMIDKYIDWTTESIRTEALNYSTRIEFARGSKAYGVAVRRGLLNDGITCSHMTAKHINWTTESIRSEALKYPTRKDFERNNLNAYASAVRLNLLDDGITCSHMNHGMYGFNQNKSAILYYIKFNIPNELSLYKIGITNLSLKERIRGMQIKKGITATVLKELWLECGIEAKTLEKELHNEFKEYKYYGDSILDNGNTELFVNDILKLDNIIGQQ